MLSVTKTFEFAASHRLIKPECSESKNREMFGRCNNMHGHNYRLEVTISGPINPDDMMILDTAKLKQIVEELVVSDLDHNNLNEVEWIKPLLPTSEVLVNAIWERISPAVSQAREGVKLKRIRLWETRTIYSEREE